MALAECCSGTIGAKVAFRMVAVTEDVPPPAQRTA